MYVCDRKTRAQDCTSEATHEVREHGRIMGRCCEAHARELDEVIDGLELVRIKHLAETLNPRTLPADVEACFEGALSHDCIRIGEDEERGTIGTCEEDWT